MWTGVAFAVACGCAAVSVTMADLVIRERAYLKDVLGTGDWLRDELLATVDMADCVRASKPVACWNGLTEGRSR